MRARLAEDRKKHVLVTYREPGSAIAGDEILIYCRKPGKWKSKITTGKGHHQFKTTAKMNALAVLRRTFKNLQKV